MQTLSNPLPQFILDRNLPAAMRWTFDKLKFRTETMEFRGRWVEVRTWTFEGYFSRRPQGFFQQWDSPKEGKQYTAALRLRGGEYRGQKTHVGVYITEYAAKDGQPLPIE